MNAIRGKLRRMGDRKNPLSLERLQDLGGCRAIMRTMQDATKLIEILKSRCPHEVWAEDDYIHNARRTGYRSHHIKFAYQGKGDRKEYNGRRIEVQIRTDLQHSWATAVESVGLYLGQELKSGKGSKDWLRLFQLMSAEFAEAEGCDPAKGTPDRAVRLSELEYLDQQLDAIQTLENMSNAFHWVNDAIEGSSRASYYIIEYDNATRKVTVTPKFTSRFAFESYEAAENSDNLTGDETANVVLIEGVKISNLKRAYPNYFGDVQLFKMQLGELLRGRSVMQYEVALQKRAITTPPERGDPSWIGRSGRFGGPASRNWRGRK
jgi:hypothetical protein